MKSSFQLPNLHQLGDIGFGIRDVVLMREKFGKFWCIASLQRMWNVYFVCRRYGVYSVGVGGLCVGVGGLCVGGPVCWSRGTVCWSRGPVCWSRGPVCWSRGPVCWRRGPVCWRRGPVCRRRGPWGLA